MSEVEYLEADDLAEIIDLLSEELGEDSVYHYVFRSAAARERWLRPMFAAAAKVAVQYGEATGIRRGPQRELVAVALWYPPDRRYPPPFYRSFRASLPLLPMMLRYPTYCRLVKLYQVCVALLPRRERLLYLAGLAVRKDFRKKQLGTRLIRWGQDGAAVANCRLFLHCSAPLVPYYSRFGFAEISQGVLPGTAETQHGLVWEPTGEEPHGAS